MENCITCNSEDSLNSIGCLFKLQGECVYYTGEPIGSDVLPGDSFDKIIKTIFSKISPTTTTTSTSSTTTSSTSSTSTSSTTSTTTTSQPFDSILTFEDSTYSFINGVSGQSLITNPTLKLEFNSLLNPVGLYNTMNISVSGNPVMQVNYRIEYLNEPFRFTNTNGQVYYGTFNNNINF